MSGDDRPETTQEEIKKLRARVAELEERLQHRQSTAQELRESEARFRTLVENAGDAFFLHGMDGRILDVNEWATKMLGYSREELLSMRVEDLDKAWTADRFEDVIKRLTPGVPITRNARPRRKDGTSIPVEVRLGLIEADHERQLVALVRDVTEREMAEAVIRDREARFRQLAEHIDSVFWLIDWIEQRVIYVSPAYERVWGRPAARLSDDPLDWLNAVHPDDRNRAEDAYYPAAVTAYDQILRVNHPTGSIRWLRVRAFPIHDHNGRVYRMAGYTEDITDFKQAEEALRDSERRFRTLASLSPVGIFETDPEGACLYVNERWCQMAGLTPADVAGSSWAAAVHPEDKERVAAAWRRATESGEEYAGEFRFRTPEGEVTWMFALALALHDENHRVTGYLGTFTDITKLKVAEDALRATEEQYRILYEDSPSMYFTLSDAGIVLSVNTYGAEQLGYTVQELLGQPVLNVFHEDDKAAVREQLANCLAHPGERIRWEFRKRRKDGSVMWVEEAARAIRAAHGRMVVLILCEDITDRRLPPR